MTHPGAGPGDGIRFAPVGAGTGGTEPTEFARYPEEAEEPCPAADAMARGGDAPAEAEPDGNEGGHDGVHST